MEIYRWFRYADEVEVVGINKTPEWESCYAYVSELWRTPDGVLFATWHGGVRSGGWDVWEVPADLWPDSDSEIEAAINAAAELVNKGAVKVKDCPYCEAQ